MASASALRCERDSATLRSVAEPQERKTGYSWYFGSVFSLAFDGVAVGGARAPPAELQRRLAFGLPARAARTSAARTSATKNLSNKRSGRREGWQRMVLIAAISAGDAPRPLWNFEELWNCIFLSVCNVNRVLSDIIASMLSERFPSVSHFLMLCFPKIAFLKTRVAQNKCHS